MLSYAPRTKNTCAVQKPLNFSLIFLRIFDLLHHINLSVVIASQGHNNILLGQGHYLLIFDPEIPCAHGLTLN